ncbi:phage tail tape measure C-terminal domain-containing protein [Stenotrophomonas sp. CFBP 13718]|uniref:phage tail tape measure C-terminal domain-containing protein n=1 Tax=Stenotrophomonas sp. CFBP 13718 TaxID=2775304 RepID=UPI0017845E85|nr:phage tail tape measure C-terminal domain-containing protein [Stenotrophomonas sp. CFBP 13718]MBD8696604.1 phage tail tape measure protein [Stenotrophomonas sp. CFBP 13718]
MADIAELGYKVDSSGLLEGTKALDDNAAAADKAGGAAERLEKDYQALSRTIERSSSTLGDRLGGALDRIGTGTGAVIAELQALNRTNVEMLASLGGLEGKLGGTASQLQSYSAAGKSAAADTAAVSTASQKLQTDIAAQEARFRSVAQQAVAYAESMRGANVSDRALAEAARESTSALNSRAMVMANAGSEQERLTSRAKLLQAAEARTAAQAKESARATQMQELNLQKLLGQIDPTVAALNRLADQEQRLAKARDLGLLKPQVFQQYQSQLEGVREKTLAASRGSDGLTNAFGRLNMQSAETQRNLSQLVTYLATGNFGMAGNQIMQLGNQAGIAGRLFSVAGVAIGGTAASLGAFAAVAAIGYFELRKLEGGLAATGNAAGFTAGELMAMRTELGRAAGNYSEVGAALGALAREGQASGATLELIAASATNLSLMTGTAVSATVNEIQTLATGGADALAKLNERYNFLTPEVYRHIEAVREQRGDYAATQSALEQFDDVMRDRANNMVESAGIVETAWKGVVSTFRGALEAVKAVGRTDLDSQLQDARDNLEFFRNLQRSPIPGDASRGRAGETDMRQRIADLTAWKAELSEGAKVLEVVQRHNRDVVATEREAAKERAGAGEALTARLAGLDREAPKLQARNKIIEMYNKLADNDARHFDGSMQRLIAQSNSQIDKQFNRSEGVGKKNADDSSAQSLLANLQRQITANEQLAESGSKVTASDRLVIQTRQLLDDKTNTMTASTRKLLEALIPTLQATDAAGQAEVQRQRGMQASIALTERLSQLEKQRQEQAQVDLMGMGRGADATTMLQRQLDIQRQYLDETEKLDKAQRDKSTALSQADYQQQQLALQASLERSLGIERSYQQQRMTLLGDWRTGVTRVWEDYVSSATNASEQAGTVVSNTLSGWEDMWVRAAKTGKLSFSDLANSVIADMARMASKQAALGLFGNALGGLFGGNSAPSTYSAQSFGNNTGWLTDGLSFGGGRARGGGVNRGSFYEVGEGGRPELLEQNGKQYLIPGNSGKVIPAAPSAGGAGGGGGSYKVEINNHGGGQVQTRQTTERMPDGSELKKLVIDIVGESLDGGDLGSLGRNKYGWQETV